jgi:hypothetical protein
MSAGLGMGRPRRRRWCGRRLREEKGAGCDHTMPVARELCSTGNGGHGLGGVHAREQDGEAEAGKGCYELGITRRSCWWYPWEARMAETMETTVAAGAPARLGNGVAALCARVRREWERGGDASEEKEGARAGHSGAPPRRGRHGHLAERRTRGVHGEDALAHGRHALPKGTNRRARGRRLCARLGGRFWAGSVHIWAKGLEPNLLTTACSTFSI